MQTMQASLANKVLGLQTVHLGGQCLQIPAAGSLSVEVAGGQARMPPASAGSSLNYGSSFAGEKVYWESMNGWTSPSTLTSKVSIRAEIAQSDSPVKVNIETPTGKQTVLRYHRPDGDYKGWGLHVWGDSMVKTSWDEALTPAGEDTYGVFWNISATPGGKTVDFLVHKGDWKDCSGALDVDETSAAWLVSERSTIFVEEPNIAELPQGNLDLAKALWVTADTIAWDADVANGTYTLYTSKMASLTITGSGVEGADVIIPLKEDPAGLSAAVKEKFPHIANYKALTLPSTVAVSPLLKSQLAVGLVDASETPVDATGIQLPGVLDDLFSYDGPLGITFLEDAISLHIWAPTAQSVCVLLFDDPSGGEPVDHIALQEEKGVWSTKGPSSWKGKYYLYEVKVFHPSTGRLETGLGVDPYARGLSANGERTLIVDLNEETLKPVGWNTLQEVKPQFEAFNDISILELHIRDFSASDQTVNPATRGGYLAFAEKDTAGVRHLKSLAAAGLTHVHLLPCYDFASVNERKETWKSVDDALLVTFAPDSEEQQAAVVDIQNEDAFNWGYDPANWGVPDGSYASDPDGPVRTKEFRTMVQALNNMGLRVVLDVVYNHTHGSGPFNRQSVLDKVVPGYYLRRNTDGAVENSTCMNNTASEHYMMNRLVVDDLVHWAKEYKVDGFRFDLMGHLMKSTMINAKEAIRSLTIEKDGIDGSKIYLYGEGWDFGEIARNQRGVNASQANLAGTGIGSFNDRIRDTALGGSPFGDPQQQGFLTGLLLQPNEIDQGDLDAQARALAATTDWIKLGLAGNLRSYSFINYEGNKVKGGEVVTHDGVPVAYASSPEEVVNYVSAHDNETLFDAIMLKTAREVPLEERCRINHLATSLIALQQGVAFFHAGDDMLRSKSLDRDSYNSGDWFNKLDFSYQSNNYGVGLPPEGKNGEKWKLLGPLLADPSLKPGSTEILAAVANLRELLSIRYSTPLLRLRTAEDIQARVEFLNSGPASLPGVIVMCVRDDHGVPSIDPNFQKLVAIFNARPDVMKLSLPLLEGSALQLHPVQVFGADGRVKLSTFSNGVFEVPPRTTAVFVEPRRT